MATKEGIRGPSQKQRDRYKAIHERGLEAFNGDEELYLKSRVYGAIGWDEALHHDDDADQPEKQKVNQEGSSASGN